VEVDVTVGDSTFRYMVKHGRFMEAEFGKALATAQKDLHEYLMLWNLENGGILGQLRPNEIPEITLFHAIEKLPLSAGQQLEISAVATKLRDAQELLEKTRDAKTRKGKGHKFNDTEQTSKEVQTALQKLVKAFQNKLKLVKIEKDANDNLVIAFGKLRLKLVNRTGILFVVEPVKTD
jgi:hypothetical protein